jgi:hypothetical protein
MELEAGMHTYAMPKGAKVLSVGLQRDRAQMWFLCDPEATEKTDRQFLFTGTGHPFDGDSLKFIGTMMNEGQTYIFHVFEKLQT